MGLIKKRIIYSNEVECYVWTKCTGKVKTFVRTWVVMKKFLWIEKFTIKQYVPYIDEPVFDGEYSSNKLLSTIAKTEYGTAEHFIDDYKGNFNK